MDREDHGHRRAGACEGLDGERVGDVVEASATRRRRGAHPQIAARGGPTDKVERKSASLVDSCGMRRDELARKRLDLGRNGGLRGCQFQMHRRFGRF